MQKLDFWQDHWQKLDIPWASTTANDVFIASYPKLLSLNSFTLKDPVFVPLCGNSSAVAYLYKNGHKVVAVDYVPEAVTLLINQEFKDISFERKLLDKNQGIVFQAPRLAIYQCDFFSLVHSQDYGLVYDRGALVAISPEQREFYVKIISRSTKLGGILFLAAAEIESIDFHGPPYSLSLGDVKHLFPHFRVIECKENLNAEPPEHLSKKGVTKVHYLYFILQKNLEDKN